MRLAFVTTYAAADVSSWSGAGYYQSRALQRAGLSLEHIGGLTTRRIDAAIAKAKRARYMMQGKRYLTGRNWRLAKNYARQVSAALPRSDIDAVFSPGSLAVCLVDCVQPILFWTDATFAGMVEYYPGFSNLCQESVREGNAIEQAALDRCRYAIYTSEWAAGTALDNYRIDAQKVKVIPFGANVGSAPSASEIEQVIAERDRGKCKLVFISVDWNRKGGDTVLEVARQLNAHGVAVELAIVGRIPPIEMPPFVHYHGFVSKATPEGAKKLDDILRGSHFLLLPSQAEAFGLAPAEGNVFGVPALTSNTGGLGTVVLDGVNGRTFRVGAPAADYAACIEALWNDWPRYAALARSSHVEYERRLNWRVAAAQVRDLLETLA